MVNVDDLLGKYDQISPKELAEVVETIQTLGSDNDTYLYSLLRILGRSGATQYRKLMEKFLYYPYSPEISGAALRALCINWSLSKHYLEHIKMFLKGVPWDTDGDIRLIAIQCAGEYLSANEDKELVQTLLSIYEDEQEDNYCRSGAYEAIALAMGQTRSEILNESKPNDLAIKRARNLN